MSYVAVVLILYWSYRSMKGHDYQEVGIPGMDWWEAGYHHDLLIWFYFL